MAVATSKHQLWAALVETFEFGEVEMPGTIEEVLATGWKFPTNEHIERMRTYDPALRALSNARVRSIINKA